MSKIVKSAYFYRPLLVVDLDGNMQIATVTPEPGMSAKQFNLQAVWRDGEYAISRKRNLVRCIRRHPGTPYSSPDKLPVELVPKELLAVLDAPTDGMFLYYKKD